MNSSLRSDLLSIKDAALQAVDPAAAVARYLKRDGDTVCVDDRCWNLLDYQRVLLVAVGKAAPAMASAAVNILHDAPLKGVVVTKYEHAEGLTLPECIAVMESGHPVPDQAGIDAAQTVMQLLADASDALVLVLLSGGGSALLPAPAAPLSLAELQATTNLLLRAGATINELNAIRKHLSALKGGQLVRLTAPAPVISLILSDVVGDPLDVIASGPTSPDSTTFKDVEVILKRFGVWVDLPDSVRERLDEGVAGKIADTPKPGEPLFNEVRNRIVASNRQAALKAAERARDLGYTPLVISTHVEGEAREVARVAVAIARSVKANGDPLPAPACVIFGGETTVTVTGKGKGGRNQELALASAIAMQDMADMALMALATDGTDGPTDSGGAIVDGGTVARAKAAGFDVYTALKTNDSYPLLDATGDLLLTGPTGTNVNDLLVVLVR